MKKLFAPALAALMLVASLSVAPPRANAQGPGLVTSILNKMDRNRRSLGSLRAAVMMQKYNAQLRDADLYYGDVQYVAAQGRDANALERCARRVTGEPEMKVKGWKELRSTDGRTLGFEVDIEP